MIGVVKTVLIIIGLSVVIQFISRLIASSSSAQNPGASAGSDRNASRKKDDNRDDGEYVEYEEIK
jgi:hypothetical protein